MPTALPILGFPSRADAVEALTAQGLKPSDIAKKFGEGFTAGDIAAILGRLSKRRGERSLKNGRARTAVLSWSAFQALQPHAHKRGISVGELVAMMADRIAADELVDAILDDRIVREAA